jgi:hypothetical protein
VKPHSPRQEPTRGHLRVVPAPVDRSDDELSALIDDDREHAHRLLHGRCLGCGGSGYRCCEGGSDLLPVA